MIMKFKVTKTELKPRNNPTVLITLHKVCDDVDSPDTTKCMFLEIDQLDAKDYVAGTVVEVSFVAMRNLEA